MTERWRRQLALIEALDPPDGLLETARRPRSEPDAARRRATPTRFVASAMVVVLALAVAGVGAWRTTTAPTDTVPAPATHPRSTSGLGDQIAVPPPWRGEQFLAVAAGGPNDVWAVGRGTPRNHHGRGVSLVEHWTGAAWIPISCPDVGELRGVTAVRSGQMWAVGQSGVVHADSAGCTRLPRLAIPGGGFVSAISADRADDVWVVGVRSGERYGSDSIGWNTLVARWNGSRWHLFDTPNLAIPDNDLGTVLAIAPTNVWAAGFFESRSGRGGPLALHWDGSTWNTVQLPVPGRGDRGIDALGSDGTSRPWVAASYTPARHGTRSIGITLRWTGHGWSSLNLPQGNPLGIDGGISGNTPQDMWAVTSAYRPDTLHFDGHHWREVSLGWPSGGLQPTLAGIVAVNASDVWAVGEWSPWCGPTQALTEHWDGHAWQRVPTTGEPDHLNTHTPKPKHGCPGTHPRPDELGGG